MAALNAAGVPEESLSPRLRMCPSLSRGAHGRKSAAIPGLAPNPSARDGVAWVSVEATDEPVRAQVCHRFDMSLGSEHRGCVLAGQDQRQTDRAQCREVELGRASCGERGCQYG